MKGSIAAAVILLAFAEPALALPPSIFDTMPCSCMQPTPQQRNWRSPHHRAAATTAKNPTAARLDHVLAAPADSSSAK